MISRHCDSCGYDLQTVDQVKDEFIKVPIGKFTIIFRIDYENNTVSDLCDVCMGSLLHEAFLKHYNFVQPALAV